MYKILVATDGSEHSERAVSEAVKIAKPMNAELHALFVKDLEFVMRTAGTSPTYAEKLIRAVDSRLEEEGRKALEKARNICRENGLEISIHIAQGHPAEVICHEAKEGGYNLIVLGSRGLGRLNELFLGSVSNKVVHRAETSVLVVK